MPDDLQSRCELGQQQLMRTEYLEAEATLAAADATSDPLQKIEGYRTTQRVDYGCELAHQKASDMARELARTRRTSGS